MGKLILIGVSVFFAVGIALEHVIDSIFSGEAEAEFNATTDRIIAAQREGTVPTPAPIQGDNSPRIYGRQMELEDCSAANISGWQLPPLPPVTARVSRVIDGDTLEITMDGIPETVRLWGIDAPEMGQKGREQARQALADLTPQGSRVTIHPLPTKGKYGRMIAAVEIDSDPTSVNFRMVAHGWAYHYRESTAATNRCLIEAERAARESKKGVWSREFSGEKPWEYRSRQQSGKPERTDL